MSRALKCSLRWTRTRWSRSYARLGWSWNSSFGGPWQYERELRPIQCLGISEGFRRCPLSPLRFVCRVRSRPRHVACSLPRCSRLTASAPIEGLTQLGRSKDREWINHEVSLALRLGAAPSRVRSSFDHPRSRPKTTDAQVEIARTHRDDTETPLAQTKIELRPHVVGWVSDKTRSIVERIANELRDGGGGVKDIGDSRARSRAGHTAALCTVDPRARSPALRPRAHIGLDDPPAPKTSDRRDSACECHRGRRPPAELVLDPRALSGNRPMPRCLAHRSHVSTHHRGDGGIEPRSGFAATLPWPLGLRAGSASSHLTNPGGDTSLPVDGAGALSTPPHDPDGDEGEAAAAAVLNLAIIVINILVFVSARARAMRPRASEYPRESPPARPRGDDAIQLPDGPPRRSTKQGRRRSGSRLLSMFMRRWAHTAETDVLFGSATTSSARSVT